MKEHSKNLIVGLTVIVSLCLLGGMILLFAGLPEWFQTGYVVHLEAPNTYGVHTNDPIYLDGIRVGRITDISFKNTGDPNQGVRFSARIDNNISIPGNAKVCVFTKGFTGTPYLEIKMAGPLQPDPRTGKPMKTIPKDYPVTLTMEHLGSGLLPPELISAVEGLGKLMNNLNAMFEAPATAPTTGPDGQPTTAETPAQPMNLRTTLGKLNRTLDALYAIAGNEENQANIKASLANLNKASANAIEAMDAIKTFAADAKTTMQSVTKTSDAARKRFDELADKLIEDADKISTLMTSINQTVVKINAGKGTLGKLANDPQLYTNLVNATQRMETLMKEFTSLVETWKKEGVKLNVK